MQKNVDLGKVAVEGGGGGGRSLNFYSIELVIKYFFKKPIYIYL